ncbi:FolM Alternative dihydrofolate reductase 1 [invertebrate metagenome]|uniref:FolM Alternative dihydrofolate reductase 1 n=1 Tax=invertebrate metagenome TaxID=1711999 RepID=A0A484H6E6_9ZZZZ
MTEKENCIGAIPQTVLITGAGKRIGRTIALDFGYRGWYVAIHYNRSADAANEIVQSIRAAGGTACTLSGDLSCEAHVATLVPRAVELLGPLGCLINNASLFERDTVHTATRESWDAHIAINLRAPFVLMQAFARQLPAELAGAVINIIDQRVWSLTPHFTSYTVSKAALWSLTQTLALALAPRIRVNAIGPGPTLPSPRQTAEQFAHQCRSMPLCRGSTPEEIAAAVRFIIGASAMTGQMVALDGGQHLGWAQPSEDGLFDE